VSKIITSPAQGCGYFMLVRINKSLAQGCGKFIIVEVIKSPAQGCEEKERGVRAATVYYGVAAPGLPHELLPVLHEDNGVLLFTSRRGPVDGR